MSEAKLTPWFPPEIQPARIGVYARDHRTPFPFYSHWNGEKWGGSWESASEAAAHPCVGPGSESWFQFLPWRGLAADPKAKA